GGGGWEVEGGGGGGGGCGGGGGGGFRGCRCPHNGGGGDATAPARRARRRQSRPACPSRPPRCPPAVTLIGIARSHARRDRLGIALPISAVLTQRRREVGDEIVGILDADREPHQGIADAQGRAHLRRHPSLGHQRGMPA